MAKSAAESRRLRILVGDDQADVLEALRLLLKGAGHQTVTVDSPQSLLRAALAQTFDLILMDLNYARDTTSGQEGLDLVTRLQESRIEAPIVVMTAWGSVDLAVEAMHRGATDFVQKPWDNARLLATIEKQFERANKQHEVDRQARSEMELARSVQQKLFPQTARGYEGVEYAGLCVSAGEVGGDYYDFLDLAPGRLGFVLADVSGKGIAAALLMANLQAAFRSQTELGGKEPAGIVEAIHRQFLASSPPEHYATLFYGEYEERRRELRYINCGHLAPLLLRASGGVDRLPATTTVLGMFPKWDCKEQVVGVSPGDVLIVFSDGVSEAGADRDADFGDDRVIALMRSCGSMPMNECIRRISDEVQAYSPVLFDDCTLVGLRFR